MVGNMLNYEIQAKAWVWYGGNDPVGPSQARRLEPGMQVGFDILVGSRYGSAPRPPDYDPAEELVRPDYDKDCNDPNWAGWCDYDADYAMLSANLAAQKFVYAANFQRWEWKNSE